MKNLPVAVLFALPLVASCIDPPTPRLNTTDDESQVNFAGMMYNTIGPLTTVLLAGYGCYCGLGNSVGVQPVDMTDGCCMTHDYAWIGAGTVAAACNCNSQNYDYNTNGGVITCAANQNACAAYCCAADKAFSECIAANPPGRDNQRYDRTQCEPFECDDDRDCEGGTWCNSEHRCVPFCGGGGPSTDVAYLTACENPTTATTAFETTNATRW